MVKPSPITLSSALLLLLIRAPILRSQEAGEAPYGAETKSSLRGVNHVVKPGETLFGIAEMYYGNGYKWTELLQYNTWVNPDRLVVGRTIFIPDPKFMPADDVQGTASPDPGVRDHGNPGFGPGIGSFGSFFGELGSARLFGMSLYKLVLILCAWFMIHAAIQGSFVWFAAHLAFVKDVSFKKAMRATVQSEGLATVFLIVVSVTALMMVYVGTAPPGKPVLSDLLLTVEDYLRSSSGMALAGFLIVGLYVFLGVRFIPQAFEIPGGQGVAIVFLAVLIPHVVFLYLIGTRMGFIGP